MAAIWEGDSLLLWAASLYSRGGPVGPPVTEAASPSPLPLGSKGAVSSGISAICSRDPRPAEVFNSAQGREERPRASLPVPVCGSSPAAGDSPLPGGARVPVVLPEEQDLGTLTHIGAH